MELLKSCKINNMRALMILVTLFAFGCKEGTVELSYTSTQDNCGSVAARSTTFANSELGGNGTTVPFKICTTQQFLNISTAMTANFEIVNDLDFSSTPITPFTEYFEGSIEGNGYTLYNVTISGDGLFDRAMASAQFRNFTMDNWEVSGSSSVGALTGSVDSTDSRPFVISNVKAVNVSVSSSSSNTGGLIGLLGSSTLTPGTYIFEDVEFSGTVTGGGSNTGGLIGYSNDDDGSLTILRSSVSGDILGGASVGGIIGYGRNELVAENLNLSLTISLANTYGGGVMGRSFNSAITLTGVKGSVTVVGSNTSSGASLAGMVGYVIGENLEVTDSDLTVSISSAGGQLGGLVGYADADLTVKNTRHQIMISGKDRVSATVGYHRDGALEASNLTIDFDFSNVGDYAAGLAGYSFASTISANGITVTGNITVADSYLAGLVGYLNSSEMNSNQISSYMNFGNVTSYIGGLVGYSGNSSAFQTGPENLVSVTIQNGYSHLAGAVGYTTESLNIKGGTYISDIDFVTIGGGGILGRSLYNNTNAITISGVTIATKMSNIGSYSGGISGEISRGSVITNSTVSATLSAVNDYVSLGIGRVGQDSLLDHLTITGSLSGSLTGSGNCGGLAGYLQPDVTVSNGDLNVFVQCQMSGGAVGSTNSAGSTHKNMTVRSVIVGGTSFAGGYVGQCHNCTLSDIEVQTVMTSADSTYMGGLAGRLLSSIASDLNVTVTLTNTDSAARNGGLAGYTRGSTVRRVFTTGTISSASLYNGGIFGTASSDATGNQLSICSSTVDVSADRFIGGLAGLFDCDNCSVEDCFYSGTLAGSSSSSTVGGLFGRILGTKNNFAQRCYVDAVLTATDPIDGPVYGTGNASQIDTLSMFYNSDNADPGFENTTGTALTSADMTSSANFPGFDFSSPVWEMPSTDYTLPGVGSYSYPILDFME